MARPRKENEIKGRIETKNGVYYSVLTWYDNNGERKRKQKTTKLLATPENLRKAEKICEELRQEYEEKVVKYHGDILFSDFMKLWLEETKHTVRETTLKSYEQCVYKVIAPYFAERKTKLCDLKRIDIDRFYKHKMAVDNLSANTIKHYQANIHSALEYAVEMEYIKTNISHKMRLPKAEKRIVDFYSRDEVNALLESVSDHQLSVVIRLGAWFGLRLGEIIGLKWQYVDFENKKIYIRGTVTDKNGLKYNPFTKRTASVRTLPMKDEQAEYLKKVKAWQDAHKKRTRKYNHQWDDFVCIRDNGDIIPPKYVSKTFPQLCVKYKIRVLRFHDLRHTNISLLIMAGANIKAVQEWAGHSSIKTTLDIYGHLQPEYTTQLLNAIPF